MVSSPEWTTDVRCWLITTRVLLLLLESTKSPATRSASGTRCADACCSCLTKHALYASLGEISGETRHADVPSRAKHGLPPASHQLLTVLIPFCANTHLTQCCASVAVSKAASRLRAYTTRCLTWRKRQHDSGQAAAVLPTSPRRYEASQKEKHRRFEGRHA